MSDAAVFRATFAGFRSLTGGGYRVSFDFDGPEVKTALEVLTRGEEPSVAKGTWFAIARLNTEEPGERDDSLKSGRHALIDTTEGKSASGRSSPELSPARTLSNRVYLRLCNNPVGRRFLEEFCQDIIMGFDVNNAEVAKQVIRARLGIASLSEVDSDPVASEQAEQLLNLFAGWERGLETPRIQQENQA